MRLPDRDRILPLTTALRSLQYVVVDVETTGGSPSRGDRVTEIAIVRVAGTGEVLDEYATLVNPDRPIPRFVSELTNITNEMVRTAPRFFEVAPEVVSRLQNAVFVAHNVPFDWGFIGAELDRVLGVELHGPRLCTVKMSRRLVPEVTSRSLGSLSQFFGIENSARHRALGDARATAVVLRHLIERLEEKDVIDWGGLEVVLGLAKPRRKRTSLPSSMENA